MDQVTGKTASGKLEISDVMAQKPYGQEITMHGAIHDIKEMSGFSFITLRKKDGVVQCIYGGDFELAPISEECTVLVTGIPKEEPRARNGFELALTGLQVLSRPKEPLPVKISKAKMNLNVNTALTLRAVTLRNLRERAVFKIQEGLARGFRDYLQEKGFTEIHTPKIVSAGAEGGSNIFKLDYFGRKAFLTQSPQFYKQIMVSVYERVFETAPVFRAEKHSTARHLNEYTSMDFEMGYIHSFYDVMEMETGMLQYVFDLLNREYSRYMSVLKIELPNVSNIPCVRFDEAKQLASEKYGRPIRDPNDLEPEEEHNIGRYFKEETGSSFVFVTHYPGKKRPFYAKDDPENPRLTLSFDLLLNGMEVTTGGERISDYDEQVAKLQAKGLNPADFESYLMLHKYGVPPHGGLGLGLERLTMALLGLDNVRYATLFPRDLNRLEP